MDEWESRYVSEHQRETLRRILSGFADVIESIGLFGSRATGRARPNSDIDLVLYGNVSADTVDRIWTLCDESDLAVGVDVVAYRLIDNPTLKDHIDSVMRPLFTQDALMRSDDGSDVEPR